MLSEVIFNTVIESDTMEWKLVSATIFLKNILSYCNFLSHYVWLYIYYIFLV